MEKELYPRAGLNIALALQFYASILDSEEIVASRAGETGSVQNQEIRMPIIAAKL